MSSPLSYDSLYDPHLEGYFQNRNIRKHLRKAGLINRNGEIISQRQYEATLKERARQEQIRTLLSHEIVQRVVQAEKVRQATLQQQLEAEAKRMIVEDVKESREKQRQWKSNELRLVSRPSTSVSNSSVHQQKTRIMNENRIYRPNFQPIRHEIISAKPNFVSRTQTSKIIKSKGNINDRCQITMVYLGPPANVEYDQKVFRSNGYEILVMQQHCGGENLVVFKKHLQPNEEFMFESRRHQDFPFALTIYIDGLIDCRISTCCEYKHKAGLTLGGKKSSFAILNVQGGRACQTCQFNEFILKSATNNGKGRSSINTNISKTSRFKEFESNQLLRTPTPNAKNEKDGYSQAQQTYKNLSEKLNEDLSWEQIGSIQTQLGNVCKEGLADYERALDHYLMSLEIFSQHRSPNDRKLRNLYLSVAHLLLLQDKKQSSLALEYFQRVLDIDSAEENLNEYYLVNDYNYLGLLYQSKKEYSQSLFHLQKSLDFLVKIKSKSNVHFNIHENNYIIDENVYDKKAFQSLSVENLPDLSELYFNLAVTYENLEQIENAVKCAEQALQISSQQKKVQIYQNYLTKLRNVESK